MIDYSRLRSVTARQLDTALLAEGFVVTVATPTRMAGA